ncbi:MAG: erythromycin esterase family protein [Anaerolineaceae bacterium]|nr:erythromycin esterase family protein [Anaerolineaceae bacterium]
MKEKPFDWKPFARKLRTVLADDDDSDLAFLNEDLRGIRIVALGEETHGTREIFQLKHRLISYLVRKQGFRVISFEAGMEPCRNIDNFVFQGKGDPYLALSSQSYWTWDTVEVMDMLKDLRQYNLSCPEGEECRFAGFDMKPIEIACDNLRRFVIASEAPEKEKALEVIASCRDTGWYIGKKQDLPDITWLNGWFALHRYTLLKTHNESAYQLARQDLRYISQYILCVKAVQEGETSWTGSRDYFMAQNVMRILDESPDLKLIVWAHNAHIANDQKEKSMGWYLRQKYGNQYYAAGFLTGGGAFQSRDAKTMELRSFTIKNPYPDSWAEEFHAQLGRQNWFIPLRQPSVQSAGFDEWAIREKGMFIIGAVFAEEKDDPEFLKNSVIPTRLNESYDAVFFLGQAQRARPNARGER